MSSRKVIIVDDESSLRSALFRVLEKKGFQVLSASSKKEAESLCGPEHPVDVALIDLRLPDGDGLQLMANLKRMYPQIQTIILTGYGTIQLAVEATQKGAYHFLTKPFNIDELVNIIEKALSHGSLQTENKILKTQLQKKYEFDNIIGHSPDLTKILEMIDRISDSDSTVLITGESGTGKELIARAIHYNSPRAEKMLVPVNCGAIPTDLLETELFGHIKGAFTGAISNRIGRFELAQGGTIFLDEIGEMSPALQVKLLRAIQQKQFESLGSTKTIQVDVRIIAATNINLEEAVKNGKFREDLFYRLNVIPIEVPPLRTRQTDIPLLVHHFVQFYNDIKNRNLEGFSQEAMDVLLTYAWPGNVRELENLIERLTILKGSGMVTVADLPEKLRDSKANSETNFDIPLSGVDFNSAVDAYENAIILQALEKTGWNRNQAAQLLKLNRTTLVEKIKKKGLKPPLEAM